MTTTVRAAAVADGVLLHDLAAATFGLACPPGTPPEDARAFVSSELSVQRFEAYLADANRAILLAEVDGRAAGYSMLIFGDPTDADVAAVVTARPTVELSKFYVLAESHGTGLSHELMAATVEAARFRGAASTWLGVNQQNGRANRFYEKSGFSLVGTKQFALGDRLEDDFVRELSLEPSPDMLSTVMPSVKRVETVNDPPTAQRSQPEENCEMNT